MFTNSGAYRKMPELSDKDKPIRQALANSDAEFARVTEDLIHLLIQKNIIMFTELPEAVQSKILKREELRSQLSVEGGSFMDDSESL